MDEIIIVRLGDSVPLPKAEVLRAPEREDLEETIPYPRVNPEALPTDSWRSRGDLMTAVTN